MPALISNSREKRAPGSIRGRLPQGLFRVSGAKKGRRPHKRRQPRARSAQPPRLGGRFRCLLSPRGSARAAPRAHAGPRQRRTGDRAKGFLEDDEGSVRAAGAPGSRASARPGPRRCADSPAREPQRARSEPQAAPRGRSARAFPTAADQRRLLTLHWRSPVQGRACGSETVVIGRGPERALSVRACPRESALESGSRARRVALTQRPEVRG